MGRVYRAFDEELGEEVALKSLHHVSPEDLFHLKHEFRVLAGLFHPSLVRLYELFVEEQERFFTMELVEGRNVVEFVRAGRKPGEPLDADALDRLANTFEQIVNGVEFLHAGGRTHGDVKPSNLISEECGRTVVLDFGLATASDDHAGSGRAEVAGSLAYLAPERLSGVPSTAASDWYGVGATLHEVVTGVPPPLSAAVGASGNGLDRSANSGEVGELISRLLSPRPADREGGEEIRAVLARAAAGSFRPASVGAHSPEEMPFVDREAPLAELRESFAAARHKADAIFVRGVSGIGKSELIARFVETAKEQGALVLKGRCRYQESVSYRALDPVIDELSTYLLGCDESELKQLVPQHANALLKLFPVLARVDALSAATEPVPPSDDEIARRAFVALRSLLRGIAEKRPIVVWVDDAQWGDRGSVGLLRSIVRTADAPRLQVIVSFRSEDEESSELLSELREGLGAALRRVVDVEPLSAEHSRELVERLECGGRLPASVKERIVADASGSPFLLSELVRHTAADPGGEASGIESVLRDRIRPVALEARQILEVVSVAGRPSAIGYVLEVAGLAAAARKHVFELCAQSLLRQGATSGRESDEIEMYHDRMREATLAAVPKERVQGWHRKLAAALRAAPHPDPERLVEHYVGAEEDEQAAEYAVIAAEAARESLRFDRAAEFFALALRLRQRGDADWMLQQRRADALANAGRGAAAADAYVLAARAGERTDPDERRHANLTGLAAEHYLYSGHVNAGLERTREVMRHFGVRTPASTLWATLAATAMRLRFLVGRTPRLRPQAKALRDSADRLHALFGTSKGTALLFPKLSDYLGMYYLREAMRAGDPEHLAIALAKEASIEGALPGVRWRRRAARLLDVASEIADQCEAPHVNGTVLTCRGAFHYFSGEWQESRRTCEEAIRIFRSECVGHKESSSITFHFLIPTVAQQGDLEYLARILPEFDEDARRRGDLTAANVLEAGDSALLRLAEGRPEDVVEAADRLLSSPSGEQYSVSHYHHLLATARAALYGGDVELAWRRIEETWKPVRSIGLLTFECYSVILKHLRASAALSLAAVDASQRSRLLRVARADEKWLARSSLPHAEPLAAAVRAGLAELAGAGDIAADELRRAADGLAAAGMPLHSAAARLRLTDGAADDARRWMQARKVVQPERMSAALLGVVA